MCFLWPSTQVQWPDYIKLNPSKVEFGDNFWDAQATIVLGLSDEQVLAKRFDKGTGPRSPKLFDPEGSYLKGLADTHYKAAMAEKEGIEKEASAGQCVVGLADILEDNSKKRKKTQALQALAKRAPKRKAKSLGSVLVA